QDAGFVPRRAHEVTETSTTVALVAAGLGVALVPESAAALNLDGVVFRSVDSDRRLDLALAWVADRPRPVVTRLLEALHTHDLIPRDPLASPPPDEGTPRPPPPPPPAPRPTPPPAAPPAPAPAR